MRRLASLFAFGVFCLWAACGPKFVETEKKVVILGFDGVDPDLVRQFMAEGRLPNLKKLSEQGALLDLGTTYPPESPVAWASFHTGMNPGKHGIYDFLRRNPDNYLPNIGTNDKVDPEFIFGLFPWRLPKAISLMQGTPFWKLTADAGIRTIALGAPDVFPPIDLPGGYMTPGLVTPDIRGTQATYHYYSTDISSEKAEDTEFGGKVTGIVPVNGHCSTRIVGPWNPLNRQKQVQLKQRDAQILQALQAGGDPSLRDERQAIQDQLREIEQTRYIEVPLAFDIDRPSHSVTIDLQGQQVKVEQGHWSGWFNVAFPVTPIISIHGICKFYPMEVGEQVKIYMSPVEMDPRNPPLPISYPRGFSAELAANIGLYKTRGWSPETAGLKELKIDEKAFLEDFHEIEDKQEAIALYTLKNKSWSLFYAYFEAPDRLQHMFWRLIDPQHPLYDAELAKQYGDAIALCYTRMDTTVGKVMAQLDDKTMLFVMSDHGFHSFRQGLNINTWLVDNGFMFLNGQTEQKMSLLNLLTQENFFRNVDWSRTKAYSLGLGLIYLNQAGREKQGIVQPGEDAARVKAEIAAKLLELRDPATGAKVVDNVYDTQKIYFGPATGFAPDLITGFAEGYRVSWQTALGAVPPGILQVNDQKWSGDHCSVDAATTSGFLVTNQKITKADPRLIDFGPTVLQIFGLPVPADMDGKPLFAPAER